MTRTVATMGNLIEARTRCLAQFQIKTVVSAALLLMLFSSTVKASHEERGDFGEFLNGIDEEKYQSLFVDYNSVLSNRAPYDLDSYSEIDINHSSDTSVRVTQDSLGTHGNNRSIISTSGKSNKVIVNQRGYDNSSVIRQVGNENTAKVNELGINNEAVIMQEGHGNNAEITLVNLSPKQGNQVSVNQQGNGNTAVITHRNRRGGANLGVSQVGDGLSVAISASTNMRVHVSQSN